eukprot:CAMPEP_0113634394 /NCGR_PEP_ID=MMETSP0017_2-20120614/17907_1 /TAXON_ID=2856 /ORGANISM="Cylindrotheca closterium" /LENGTH=514 /DNA_ID=CAMNT_0000545087 /DNA_START=248 /DNA_END=1792 /DNA_ORIENTATION=- /assembly_acc=CAM_ASM_000147
MTLEWTTEASQAAADLINENSSLDYALFTIPNPKKAKPQVVVESKGNGGRAVFDLFCDDASQTKVLTGAFVVSAVDEKGSVTSVRRKLVHVTFAGSQVGIMTKGKLNGWSGPFRDPFPGCATYLQLFGGDLDDLQEGDLEATLMAAGGATKYDFSNQTLRGSVGLPEMSAPAPAPAPIVSSGKKFKMPVKAPEPPTPEPTPEPAAPAPEPAKITKTQEALQKMKAHKEAMKRNAEAEKTSSPERPVLQPVTVQEKEPTPPEPTPTLPKLPPGMDADNVEFVMLMSTQSGSNKQKNDCRASQQILESIGVQPTIVDGADPLSKKKRDKLFRVSGIQGNYPQFFVLPKGMSEKIEEEDEEEEVVKGDAMFFGDYNMLSEKRKNGTLAAEIGLGDDALSPLPEQEENTEGAASSKKLILLISSMCNAKVMAEQNHAQAVIEGLGIDMTNQLEVLDGCDQQLRDRRNELWGVSGIRAQYPQLFTVDDASSKIQFVGDYENIMYLNDHGSLAQEIGLSA